MTNQLTPKQIEDLQDGWHTAIVFGVGDFDTLHAFLTCPDCDAGGGRELWERISQQIKAQHFLSRVERELESEAQP